MYTTLLIISVRRSVFYRYLITIKYKKKRHYCIFDFHLNVIFNTQRRFFSYSSDKARIELIIWNPTFVQGGLADEFF